LKQRLGIKVHLIHLLIFSKETFGSSLAEMRCKESWDFAMGSPKFLPF